jgi:uncharacterized membrane protein (DUF4010 family)
MNALQTDGFTLLLALLIGLLFGVERGWRHRETPEGERTAGLRTFALLGLLGGICALLAARFGGLVFGLAFLAVALVLVAAHRVESRVNRDLGMTSVAAALLAFGLGGLSVAGEPSLAAASAVLAALLLSYKRTLHGWLGRLQRDELLAVLKLLLISVVVLPLLPDRGYGPWDALNPRAIWWMVVLIASISFVGYVAVRIGGTQRGLLFTGLFAGLASSTALTLQFSRAARASADAAPLFAAAILIACGTMFPRMLLVASLIHPALFQALWPAASIMLVGSALPALWFWHRGARDGAPGPRSLLKNPLDLLPALGFGALLALVMLLGEGLRRVAGDAGLLALAGVSGLSDVDAITLSFARMASADLALQTASTGIVVAAASNTLAKAALASGVGGVALARRVVPPLALSAVAGLLVIFLLTPS